MKALTIKQLNEMKPLEVLEHDAVKDRFISIYNKIHNSKEGEHFYEKEKFNFQKIVTESEQLKKASGFSTYGTLLDLAAMGFSCEKKTKPLVYVMSRGKNEGTREKPNWVQIMYVDISPYGELAARISAGQILYADNPVIAYKGDKFEPYEEKGQKFVDYRAAIPRGGNEVIGGFIKITRPDKSFDYSWMLPEDIDRLKGYSTKQNKGKTNALYTSDNGGIDKGFFETKIMKHAFKAFPKLKLGQFSQMQTAEEEIQAMDYGLDEEVLNSQIPESEKEPETFADSKPEPEAEKPKDTFKVEFEDEDEDFF